MSPDRMDAIAELLAESPAEIRALHQEIMLLRNSMMDNNKATAMEFKAAVAELKLEMQNGFSAITGQCRARLESCDRRWRTNDHDIATLDKGQAVNKTKLGILIGGTALGGGVLAKLFDWLTK